MLVGNDELDKILSDYGSIGSYAKFVNKPTYCVLYRVIAREILMRKLHDVHGIQCWPSSFRQLSTCKLGMLDEE